MELFLINFSNKKNKKENSIQQKKYSAFFVDYILKNIYKVKDTLKKDENGKPYLLNSSFEISISHSRSLLAIIFDKNKIGVDVEYIKKRNYKKILEYFNIDNDLSETEFYQWWTIYEAEFKSKIKDKILSFKYKDFMCSVSSNNNEFENIFETEYFNEDGIIFKKYEIKEFYLPLNIKNTAKTIKTKPTK